MENVSGQRILIVRGEGGRETLKDTLIARGAQVDYLNVYRRVCTQLPPVQQLKALLEQAEQIIVTLTSVDILEHWRTLLADQAAYFVQLPYVASSSRIAIAAKGQGMRGDCIVAPAAGNDALLGAIINWHARARTGSSM
jgi:uroporphyrinogen-III synthase